MNVCMKSTQFSALPAPPNLFSSFRAGFDIAARGAVLFLFPVTLDLLIWLGPSLRISQLVNRLSDSLFTASASANIQSPEALELTREVWAVVAERFNLMLALRSYPVGIPSLMASRLPVDKPGLIPLWGIDISSWGGAAAIWLLLSVLGLAAGTLYCLSVASLAVPSTLRKVSLTDLPWAALQVISLTVLWMALMAALSIPFFCVLTILVMVNPGLANFAGLMMMGGAVWLFMPLFFSPHGIFVYRLNAFASLKRSIRITRTTLPVTGLFFLSVLFLSQGMNMLWRVPPENSWLTLVGLFGHAFITTALLAASFIYYRQADQFTQRMLSYWTELRTQTSGR
jgi:hypothetical protein